MVYPEAYIQYLVHFHGTRDYFECHEVLEDEWKKDPQGERKNYWRALIQIAVALYHWRRKNFKGATRSVTHALNNMESQEKAITQLALDPTLLKNQLQRVREAIAEEKSYKSINLPIMDQALTEQCMERCRQKGCVMGNPSDLSDNQLLHKHQLPNREEIISRREAKKNGTINPPR